MLGVSSGLTSAHSHWRGLWRRSHASFAAPQDSSKLSPFVLSGKTIVDSKKKRHYSGFDTVLGPDASQASPIKSAVMTLYPSPDPAQQEECYRECAKSLVGEAAPP